MNIRLAEKEDFTELRNFYIIMNEVINKRTDLYDEKHPYFPSGFSSWWIMRKQMDRKRFDWTY